MNRPSPLVMGVGHPVVVVPITVITFGVVVGCFHSGSFGPLVPFLPVAVIVQRAQAQASAYRRWRREWDAMNPPPPRAASQAGLKVAMILGGFVGLWLLYRLGHHTTAGEALAAWAAGVLTPFAGVRLFPWVARRWHGRPLRLARVRPVTAFRRGLSLGASSVDQAYARLPDYCQHLLTAGRS